MKVLKQTINKIKQSAFWKSVATLSAGQIIAQAINLISIPILSRIYLKQYFTSFGILTSVSTIVGAVIALGFGSAIMAAPTLDESRLVLRAGYAVQVILAVVFVALMNLISPFHRFFDVGLPYWLASFILLFHLLTAILSGYLTSYMNRLRKNKAMFFNPLIGALVNLFITLPLGLLGGGIVGLYVGIIISNIIIIIHFLKQDNPFTKIPSFKEVLFVFKNYKAFVYYQYPANIASQGSAQIPTQVFYNRFEGDAVADFNMCNRVVNAPLGLIVGPIQTIYFREATEKFRDNKIEELADFTFKLIINLMLLFFLPVLILMIFAEPLAAFALGKKWYSAGTMAYILAPHYLMNFISSCVAFCRVAINRQKVNLIASLFQFAAILSGILIGALCYGTLTAAVIGFSAASTVFQIINLTTTFKCLKKYTAKFFVFSTVYLALLMALSVLFRAIII